MNSSVAAEKHSDSTSTGTGMCRGEGHCGEETRVRRVVLVDPEVRPNLTFGNSFFRQFHDLLGKGQLRGT